MDVLKAMGPVASTLAGGAALVDSWRIGNVEVVAATLRGASRPENQDAYALHPGPPLRVGVFDGVGGLPNGAQAAWAAAKALGTPDLDLVAALHSAVRATGGATTAAIAEPHDHRITVTLIGDSAAYELGDQVRRIGTSHAIGGQLTQALGASGNGTTITLPFSAPVLLSTDGLPHQMIHGRLEDLNDWAQAALERSQELAVPDDMTFAILRPRT